MKSPDDLLELAARCEQAGRADRALDADIYEALGYTVRRKPAALASRRAPAGGIYLRGRLWKGLGAVSGNIDVAVSLLRERAPDWSWRLQSSFTEDSSVYQALVDGCAGGGVMASLALCSAMLRAFARQDAASPATEAGTEDRSFTYN